MAPVIPTCRRIAIDDRVPSVSASAIVGGSASGYHVLGIRGYSSIKVAFPNGKHFDSLPFRVAGHTWFIRYFPNGDSPETADHISLYLHLKDQLERGDELMVQFMISFMDQVEKQKPAFVGSLEARRFGTNGSWGYKEFIKKESLEQSKRLKDDCFSIRCDIIVTGLPRAEAAAAFRRCGAASRVATAFQCPPPRRKGCRCEISCRGQDICRAPVCACCTVAGLRCAALWPDEGRHLHRELHTD
jgi:speckle-type POZ protein